MTTVRAIHEVPVLTIAPPRRKRGRPKKSESLVIESAAGVESVTRKPAPTLHHNVLQNKKPVMSATEPTIKAKSSLKLLTWTAGIGGMLLGGLVPLATYETVHHEASLNRLYWILVAGGLVYSSTTMFMWACKFLDGNRVKAVGFVVILEGTLTFNQTPWLSLTCLATLMVLNGISASQSFIARVHAPREVTQ